jgi:rRNA maturation endonuclease Nob1
MSQTLDTKINQNLVCDIEKGTRCKDSFPDYKDGKCRVCGGQAN